MELEIHDFQANILRELLFNPGSRFSDLNKVGVTNDHFSFHVNKLIKDGLIAKEEGKYVLTADGKEFANRLDTDSLKLERQAKLGVALHAVRDGKNGTEYLIHQRLKEPFFGWYGPQTGKIRWGEMPLDCAQREFMEETGQTGDFIHKGIVHYHDFHIDGRLLEDKYLWVFRVENASGNFLENVEGGKNIWMNEQEFRKLKNVFATFDEISEVINNKGSLVYLDRTRFVDSY